MTQMRFLPSGSPLLVLAFLAGCGGGGGGGSNGVSSSFQLNSLSVQNGSVWPINREIVLTFTDPIDFSTVSANTINLRSADDVPATGVFLLRDPRTVVFQPTCPRQDDLSDAGLQPGGVTYTLRILGSNTSPNTVRSMSGVPLGVQQTRTFTTPASTQSQFAFQDTHVGPPVPVVRSAGSTDLNATYLEIGGDPNNRVYFEEDANQQVGLSTPGFLVPLNLYSDRTSRVAVLVVFNQPISPSVNNLSESRLRLEFRDSLGAWIPIETRVSLQANCTLTGATVRLEPVGVLPSSSQFRAVVLPGFQDLVGETVRDADAFAVAPTRTVDFTSLDPAGELSDAIHETFDFGGESPLSFEDTTALFSSPVAEWGGGQLSAAFSFDGTGGPNGDFDWVVHTGEVFFFDTTNTPIVGGPNGVPTTTINAVNGVLDVRNLVIEQGGEVRVQGPNPMLINATGDVIIRGKLDLSGFNAKNVSTLNTGNQVEIGGAGTAGGGRGGNANENTTGPSPRGGRGSGPFRQANLGGEGGEMGVNSNRDCKNCRRPGGGGGGRFARDWVGTTTGSPAFSLVATSGFPGNPGGSVDPTLNGARGAISRIVPAPGGAPGVGPFVDSSTTNDFFGVLPVVQGGQTVDLIRGELSSLWAGYGGGGGGNAGTNYPNANWNFNSDEKGGGGGGGAGGLHVKALGKIVFGATGFLLAAGGRGATGENTNFLDHVGGTGGGGSGGHVILESATAVDFTDGGANIGGGARDFVLAAGPSRNVGSTAYVDNCCIQMSNGGAGSGGVVQIHVPKPTVAPSDNIATSDLIVPTPALSTSNPIDEVTAPPAYVLIPTFGARSTARSKWISIGGADKRSSGPDGLVKFLFDGIQTSGVDAGKILTTGSTVTALTPLMVDLDLENSSTSSLLSDGLTIEMTGAAIDAIRSGSTSGISNDIYLRTPALLEGCSVRMFVAGVPANFEDFPIARARYDEGTAAPGDEVLTVTVSSERGLLSDFNPGGSSGVTAFQLQPRFFQVVTNGINDSLPTSAFVRIRFQAATDNGAGAPDENAPLVDWTSDISAFNGTTPGLLQYFRYEVEFDLDASDQGVTRDTEPVNLDFLKIPFVF